MNNLPFLKQIANLLQSEYADRLDEVTLVFPNIRAGLFFRKYLGEIIEKPIWAPNVVSMEDFVHQYNRSQIADKFSLIVELYQAYKKHIESAERFDRFYYWGEMLLADFDDIDKYMIDASYLFTDVSNQKELDDYFDYLTEEQKKIILEFWSTFSDQSSEEKKNFRVIWGKLNQIYADFKQALADKNRAYSGMVYKQVASQLPQVDKRKPVVFAGFNALTVSEEKIISHFIVNGAIIKWDNDDYYMQDERQEAGIFMRKYREKNIFRESLKAPYPDNINAISSHSIHVHGVAQKSGQIKLLGHLLNNLLNDGGVKLEKTVVVLPDESLLFPVLNSLPASIDKINVTMGFSLTSTTLYGLLEYLLQLQQKARKHANGEVSFYYKNVLQIFKHPLVNQLIPEISFANIFNIESKNLINVKMAQLEQDAIIMPVLFVKLDTPGTIIGYLQKIIGLIAASDTTSAIEKEFAYQFYTQLNKVGELIDQFKLNLELDAFIRLFRQMMQQLRLPFTGEPLNGLQIMGVLETRNLDFENVFILSMNEGTFPAAGKGHSFIPYNIRKAYDLPTFDHQDAIYAYLFYRLLQYGKNVHLFYNTEGGATGGAELSRYVQQLKFESKRDIQISTNANAIAIEKSKPITIEKSKRVVEKLNKYLIKEGVEKQHRLTPSAINIYLDCRLRFYFRYVAEIYEYDHLEDQIDPMVFGNILHNAMENIYTPQKGLIIEKEAFVDLFESIPNAVRKAIEKHYSVDNIKLEGRNILTFEIVKKYINQVLTIDKNYAPFELQGLEVSEYVLDTLVEGVDGDMAIGIKGIIDRIDKKGEKIRIIDYKTGKDDRNINGILSLFDRNDKKRNKAAMQTILYSLIYARSVDEISGPLVPAIFNTKETFSKKFDYHLVLDKEPIVNIKPYLMEFEENLKNILAEIYSPIIPFDQTDEIEKCDNCPYNNICNR